MKDYTLDYEQKQGDKFTIKSASNELEFTVKQHHCRLTEGVKVMSKEGSVISHEIAMNIGKAYAKDNRQTKVERGHNLPTNRALKIRSRLRKKLLARKKLKEDFHKDIYASPNRQNIWFKQ